jgi:hypothetical protein
MRRWIIGGLAVLVVVGGVVAALVIFHGDGDPATPLAQPSSAPSTPTTTSAFASPPPDTATDGASACLSDGGTSLGDRAGDIDGDGKEDHATLIRCKANQYLAVQVRFGTGSTVVQSVSEEPDFDAGHWLGISDVNGDGHGDLVFIYTGGAHLQGVKLVEYRDGRLTAMRGDELSNGLSVDGSVLSNSGFTCSSHNGVARLVLAGVALDEAGKTYVGDESTLEADASGVFHKISSRKLSYPAVIASGYPEAPQAVNELAGAHCKGLDVFPS